MYFGLLFSMVDDLSFPLINNRVRNVRRRDLLYCVFCNIVFLLYLSVSIILVIGFDNRIIGIDNFIIGFDNGFLLPQHPL